MNDFVPVARVRSRKTLGYGARPTTIPARRARPAPQPDADIADLLAERPRTRGDCAGGQRPCPWVSCRYHLYLDANPENGSLRINFPDREPWDLAQTCALDVAGEHRSLDEIGKSINVTRERVRQIEERGLARMRLAGVDLDPAAVPAINPGKRKRDRLGIARVRDALKAGSTLSDRDLARHLHVAVDLVSRQRRGLGLPPSPQRASTSTTRMP